MISVAVMITYALLSLSLLFLFIRLVIGPSTADRVVAVDLIAVTSIGFILLISISTNEPIYTDIAIALGFVAFLTTVACSRFILFERKGRDERSNE